MLQGETSTSDFDVVEALMAAHLRAGAALRLAAALSARSATSSTAEAAHLVAEALEHDLPHLMTYEEDVLAPHLAGRHPVVDEALRRMAREHFQLLAGLRPVATMCRSIARDAERLHALRFPLEAAVDAVAPRLAAHHEREASIVLPAIRRLLPEPLQRALRRGLRRRPRLDA
jgi:hypothetical protein